MTRRIAHVLAFHSPKWAFFLGKFGLLSLGESQQKQSCYPTYPFISSINVPPWESSPNFLWSVRCIGTRKSCRRCKHVMLMKKTTQQSTVEPVFNITSKIKKKCSLNEGWSSAREGGAQWRWKCQQRSLQNVVFKDGRPFVRVAFHERLYCIMNGDTDSSSPRPTERFIAACTQYSQ